MKKKNIETIVQFEYPDNTASVEDVKKALNELEKAIGEFERFAEDVNKELDMFEPWPKGR